MTETNQLLNAEALGQKLQLSKRQVFRLNAVGKIPKPIRIGGSVRWSEQIINHWLSLEAPDRKTFEAMQNGSFDE